MKEFDDLIAITDQLLGPEGCPWDRKQTIHSVRTYVLEETYELLDAIDMEDNSHIKEELGDFFFTALFLCKIAEKEKRFTPSDVLQAVKEKLVRRHPHVFGDKKISHFEELFVQWETIKSKEEHHLARKSLLDGIPKTLPALARAQKILKRLKRAPVPPMLPTLPSNVSDEKSLGEALFALVAKASELGIDAEDAMRKISAQVERTFREGEAS